MTRTRKMKVPNSAEKKQWYNIKGRTEGTWSAYEIPPEKLADLLPGFTFRGPFKNLMHCLIASNG